MHTLKAILGKYSAWIWAVLSPLGAFGVFAIAAVDSALFGMPLDAVVAGYVYHNPKNFWLYVLMASAGSALGSLLIYAIGYTGGEVLLEKRIGRKRFEQIHTKFERHEFLALMLPAMLPPPTPFKAFVLAAAVFEMRLRDFLLAIFFGRVVRFGILSLLVLVFGPRVITILTAAVRENLPLVLLAVAVLAILGISIWRMQSKRTGLQVSEEKP